MSDIDPKLRWRQAMRRGTCPDPGRSDCPDADTLALLIAQPEAAPTELISHVERCSACAAELQSFSELPELETMIDRLTNRPSRWKAMLPLAAAACLIVAVVASGILLFDEVDYSQVRSVQDSADIEPVEGALLDVAPLTISWQSEHDALDRFILFDDHANRLWISDLTASARVELPESLRESLTSGRYYWQVRSAGGDVTRGPYSFVLSTDDER